jgi:hemerythrin-like domain-containing protein
MDAITLLKDDHKQVEHLFKQFESAGDRAFVQKRQLVDRMIEELSRHAAIEEQVFYPAARAVVPDTGSMVLESLEEHHIVKWLLHELEGMDPEDERFDAKVTVLIENVRHHVEEEESDLFPQIRDELGRNSLSDLGESLQSARGGAPTHPHPRSPDVPPLNVVTGAVAGAVDKIGDTVSGVAQGSVAAVKDLANRAFDLGAHVPGPVGSTMARRKASGVREAGEIVTDGAKQTVRAARNGAAKTAKTATAGAKGTATSARKAAKSTTGSARNAAKRTTSTAKRGATTTKRTASSSAKKTANTAKRTARKATSAASR